MLSNAYFLAKIRFDTAENEPAKKMQNFANFPNFANPNPRCAEEPPADLAGTLAGRAPRVGARGAHRHLPDALALRESSLLALPPRSCNERSLRGAFGLPCAGSRAGYVGGAFAAPPEARVEAH